jgi:hypothetical protein
MSRKQADENGNRYAWEKHIIVPVIENKCKENQRQAIKGPASHLTKPIQCVSFTHTYKFNPEKALNGRHKGLMVKKAAIWQKTALPWAELYANRVV